MKVNRRGHSESTFPGVGWHRCGYRGSLPALIALTHLTKWIFSISSQRAEVLHFIRDEGGSHALLVISVSKPASGQREVAVLSLAWFWQEGTWNNENIYQRSESMHSPRVLGSRALLGELRIMGIGGKNWFLNN